jgi:HK97 family phage prohead protease
MFNKTCDVAVKAVGKADGLEDGQFIAIVSVFGNVDSYGDVVVKGAFSKTLAEWEESGSPIPVYYSHRMDDPDYNIGWVLEAKETDEGLWVKAQLDLEGGKAPQVHRLLKSRRVTQFSFAYDIRQRALGKRDGMDVQELLDLKLYEVGPTPIGANEETELLEVKSLTQRMAQAVKSGRTISSKNLTALKNVLEQIKSAGADIENLLASVEDPDAADDEEEKSKAMTDTANTEEPSQANVEEPDLGAAEREEKTMRELMTRALSLR